MWEVQINVATIALFFVLLALAFMKYTRGEKQLARRIAGAGLLAVVITEIALDHANQDEASD
jgi:hypothetical protein